MRHVILPLLAIGCASTEPALEAELAAKESCAAVVPKDHPTVQAAVDAVADGSTVCVAAGTWTENLVISGRDVRIAGLGRSRTVLDGGGAGATLAVDGSTLELARLTVTGGVADHGGGLDVVGSTVLLEGVTVTANLARVEGGGLAADASDVTLTDVRFTRNRSDGLGGGIWLDDTALAGDHVTVTGNVAAGGGGLATDNLADVWLANSHFLANKAPGPGGDGGGMWLNTTAATFENVRIAGNEAGGEGGGVYGIGAYAPHAFHNSAIVGNVAGYGGATYGAGYGHTFVIVNTLVAFNDGGMMADKFGTLDASHSVFWDNAGADVDATYANPIGTDGNFAADPMVVSTAGRPAQWDLHLRPGSPLIDAGDPAILDPDGSVSDIGLYGGPLAE